MNIQPTQPHFPRIVVWWMKSPTQNILPPTTCFRYIKRWIERERVSRDAFSNVPLSFARWTTRGRWLDIVEKGEWLYKFECGRVLGYYKLPPSSQCWWRCCSCPTRYRGSIFAGILYSCTNGDVFVAGGILLRGWFYAVFCCPGRFPCTELRDAWKGHVGRIRYLFIGQTIKDGKARIYLGPWPSHGLSFTGVQDGGDTTQ